MTPLDALCWVGVIGMAAIFGVLIWALIKIINDSCY